MLGRIAFLNRTHQSFLMAVRLFTCGICLCLFPSVFAAEPSETLGLSEEIKAEILNLGNVIADQQLFAPAISSTTILEAQKLPPLKRVTAMRRLASAVVMERRDAAGADIFDTYRKSAIVAASPRDIAIADLFEHYQTVQSIGPEHPDAASSMAKILAQKNAEDWFVRHRSYVLHAALLARQRDYNGALRELNVGAQIIPTAVDMNTREASYEQSTVLAYISTVTGNVGATTNAVQQIITQGRELGEPVDGISHFNNLIYVSSKWREFELSTELARKLIIMPGLSDQDKAIGYMRLAQSLNRTGDFTEAGRAAEAGLALNPPKNWAINLQVENAIALAGMGQVEKAHVAIEKIKSEAKGNPRYEAMFQKSFLQVDALIAVAKNNPSEVYSVLMTFNRVDMQRQLHANERSNNDYLQSLQKSEALTRVREAKQRAEIEAVTLQRDNRTKQLAFMVLITVMLGVFTAIGLLLARFYKRTSQENAALRDQAMAGERSKSEFLAVMSHELRTPLNGIIGLSDILSREAEAEDVKFKSSVIMRSGLTLLDLLTNILDISKMERGQLTVTPAPMSIHELIDSLRELWMPKAQSQGLTLTLHIDATVPPYLMIDAMRFRQCAENMISNAIKFTKKGRVHVHVTADPPGQDGILNLILIVADTGRGMTQNQIDNVFEPFTQADTTISREFGGSGLGMAITQSLARMMDGDITIKSREGRGTEFTMTIKARIAQAPKIAKGMAAPEKRSAKTEMLTAEITESKMALSAQRIEKIDAAIAAANHAANQDVRHKPKAFDEAGASRPASTVMTAEPAVNTEQTHPNGPARLVPEHDIRLPDRLPALRVKSGSAQSDDSFQGLKILIAEDIVSNQDVLKVFLGPVGVNVTCVFNGAEAVQAMMTDHYDVVLMDVRMPIMDGIEATAKIRRLGTEQANIPIIALTADASAENNAKCMAAGANVFLTKPIVAAELFGSIRFVLKQAEQQRLRRRTA